MKRKRPQKIRLSGASILFNVISYTFIIVLVVFCLLPFLMLISGSISSEKSIIHGGYSIFPKDVSFAAYRLLFSYPDDILRAYAVSIGVTLGGTFLGLFVVTMAAYVLSRKDFRYRNAVSFFFYFTTLFSGGILSTYIFFIRYLQLKNSYLALILPLAVNVFYLLIMRSFVSSIPDSIIESAKIDGAGEFSIFIRFILPLSTSGLATIGLFFALDYWNDWYNAMLYINNQQMYPLQYLLYRMLSAAEAMARLANVSSVPISDLPSRSLKLAMAVVATGPILLVYPFVQKYFIKGITIGAVKG